MKTYLHVTDLDAWRWFKVLDDMTTQDFINKLLRTAPPNEIMEAGTGWHKVMENPPDSIDTIESNGFKYVVECEKEISLPQIREIRASKTYPIDGVDVTLTGGCDGITGNKVSDHKLSFNPDPERYFASAQWRAYLDIYNADVFEYIIYHAFQDGKTITIRDVSTIKMYRYPAMVQDLLVDTRELIGFIKKHVPQMIKED